MSIQGTLTPAEKLAGMILPNGWTVIAIATEQPGATGGCFSVGYKVKHDNEREAFLKTIDLSHAFQDPDPLRELQRLTETFNFERDLLEKV